VIGSLTALGNGSKEGIQERLEVTAKMRAQSAKIRRRETLGHAYIVAV
jgi:hypothetical protein